MKAIFVLKTLPFFFASKMIYGTYVMAMGTKNNFLAMGKQLLLAILTFISCTKIYKVHVKLYQQVNKELAVKMYGHMVTLQMMDTLFYEAQRQGRISFYMTTFGEEAINIASAAALGNDDIVLPQVIKNLDDMAKKKKSVQIQ